MYSFDSDLILPGHYYEETNLPGEGNNDNDNDSWMNNIIVSLALCTDAQYKIIFSSKIITVPLKNFEFYARWDHNYLSI